MRTARVRVRVKGTGHYLNTFEPAFDGASRGRRLANWWATRAGPNASLTYALEELRARSRDLTRKTPWAAGGLDTWVANLVGTGIVPEPKSPDKEWRSAVKENFKLWAAESDADGVLPYWGQQALAVRSMVEAGECFIRRRRRFSGDGLHVPLQLQLLEPDLLPVNWNTVAPSGNRIVNGIELDAIGRRVAYWLYRTHPGEYAVMGTVDGASLVAVPASEILHVYRPLRPGQLRGYPWLASVIAMLRDMLEYSDAELVRKKFAAMITAFITTSETAPEDTLNAKTGATAGNGNVDPGPGIASGTLEPGTTQVLMPGEDVKFSEAAEVGQSYEPFMRTTLRAIFVGWGLTYEQGTGDLSGVNFSSIRAGLNEFKRRCEALQQHIIAAQICQAVIDWWIPEAILAGVLPMPAGYGQNPRPWHACAHVAPGWRYVNPKDEVAAQIAAIRGGVTSRRQVVAENGDDVEQVDAETAADRQREDALGLTYDTRPDLVNSKGLLQPDVAPGTDGESGGGDGSGAADTGGKGANR
jgi:lambda family phage portal protein